MEAHVLVQSYDTYGAHPSFSIIGALLEHATGDLSCGVASFEATVCLRTNLPPKRTLEALQSEFHAELETLPRIRWEAKKRRLSVRYQTRLGLAEELLYSGPPSGALVQSALAELATVLQANERSLARRPGLDARSFLELIDSLSQLIPMTDADVAAFRDAHAQRRRAKLALLPWSEQLGIDWAEYHPAARELLDDPFFWQQADDYSPHGNDTGADLLSDFRAWRRAHRASSPVDFLHRALRQWGFSMDWKRLPVDQWGPEVELAVQVHDEAAIALAFALIKLEGSCATEARVVALEALGRQADPRVGARFGWTIVTEREQALRKLRKALEDCGAP